MLAELIQKQMEAKKWTSQLPLIRRSNLSQAMISKLLRGEVVNITAHTADRLAGALDLEPAQVFAAALEDVRKANQETMLAGEAA